MIHLLKDLEAVALAAHTKSPKACAIVRRAITALENQTTELLMLAELLARLEKDKATAIAEAKDAAAKELADLTAAGRLLSESDAAALKAELAKNGLDANGNLIAVATA